MIVEIFKIKVIIKQLSLNPFKRKIKAFTK